MFPENGFADYMKKTYPPGTRIMLDRMGDDPNPIPAGTVGTVQCVDDMGQIHCSWDNGRSLALVPGEDDFHEVHDKKKTKEYER